ncbi:unnamed protein product [Amoebophrya sp. A120]|nr:unnamed protein product [Amoebophrya sp. A120]|eukprot:GSA120T00022197001.1
MVATLMFLTAIIMLLTTTGTLFLTKTSWRNNASTPRRGPWAARTSDDVEDYSLIFSTTTYSTRRTTRSTTVDAGAAAAPRPGEVVVDMRTRRPTSDAPALVVKTTTRDEQLQEQRSAAFFVHGIAFVKRRNSRGRSNTKDVSGSFEVDADHVVVGGPHEDYMNGISSSTSPSWSLSPVRTTPAIFTSVEVLDPVDLPRTRSSTTRKTDSLFPRPSRSSSTSTSTSAFGQKAEDVAASLVPEVVDVGAPTSKSRARTSVSFSLSSFAERTTGEDEQQQTGTNERTNADVDKGRKLPERKNAATGGGTPEATHQRTTARTPSTDATEKIKDKDKPEANKKDSTTSRSRLVGEDEGNQQSTIVKRTSYPTEWNRSPNEEDYPPLVVPAKVDLQQGAMGSSNYPDEGEGYEDLLGAPYLRKLLLLPELERATRHPALFFSKELVLAPAREISNTTREDPGREIAVRVGDVVQADEVGPTQQGEKKKEVVSLFLFSKAEADFLQNRVPERGRRSPDYDQFRSFLGGKTQLLLGIVKAWSPHRNTAEGKTGFSAESVINGRARIAGGDQVFEWSTPWGKNLNAGRKDTWSVFASWFMSDCPFRDTVKAHPHRANNYNNSPLAARGIRERMRSAPEQEDVLQAARRVIFLTAASLVSKNSHWFHFLQETERKEGEAVTNGNARKVNKYVSHSHHLQCRLLASGILSMAWIENPWSLRYLLAVTKSPRYLKPTKYELPGTRDDLYSDEDTCRPVREAMRGRKKLSFANFLKQLALAAREDNDPRRWILGTTDMSRQHQNATTSTALGTTTSNVEAGKRKLKQDLLHNIVHDHDVDLELDTEDEDYLLYFTGEGAGAGYGDVDTSKISALLNSRGGGQSLTEKRTTATHSSLVAEDLDEEEQERLLEEKTRTKKKARAIRIWHTLHLEGLALALQRDGELWCEAWFREHLEELLTETTTRRAGSSSHFASPLQTYSKRDRRQFYYFFQFLAVSQAGANGLSCVQRGQAELQGELQNDSSQLLHDWPGLIDTALVFLDQRRSEAGAVLTLHPNTTRTTSAGAAAPRSRKNHVWFSQGVDPDEAPPPGRKNAAVNSRFSSGFVVNLVLLDMLQLPLRLTFLLPEQTDVAPRRPREQTGTGLKVGEQEARHLLLPEEANATADFSKKGRSSTPTHYRHDEESSFPAAVVKQQTTLSLARAQLGVEVAREDILRREVQVRAGRVTVSAASSSIVHLGPRDIDFHDQARSNLQLSHHDADNKVRRCKVLYFENLMEPPDVDHHAPVVQGAKPTSAGPPDFFETWLGARWTLDRAAQFSFASSLHAFDAFGLGGGAFYPVAPRSSRNVFDDVLLGAFPEVVPTSSSTSSVKVREELLLKQFFNTLHPQKAFSFACPDSVLRRSRTSYENKLRARRTNKRTEKRILESSEHKNWQSVLSEGTAAGEDGRDKEDAVLQLDQQREMILNEEPDDASEVDFAPALLGWREQQKPKFERTPVFLPDDDEPWKKELATACEAFAQRGQAVWDSLSFQKEQFFGKLHHYRLLILQAAVTTATVDVFVPRGSGEGVHLERTMVEDEKNKKDSNTNQVLQDELLEETTPADKEMDLHYSTRGKTKMLFADAASYGGEGGGDDNYQVSQQLIPVSLPPFLRFDVELIALTYLLRPDTPWPGGAGYRQDHAAGFFTAQPAPTSLPFEEDVVETTRTSSTAKADKVEKRFGTGTSTSSAGAASAQGSRSRRQGERGASTASTSDLFVDAFGSAVRGNFKTVRSLAKFSRKLLAAVSKTSSATSQIKAILLPKTSSAEDDTSRSATSRRNQNVFLDHDETDLHHLSSDDQTPSQSKLAPSTPADQVEHTASTSSLLSADLEFNEHLLRLLQEQGMTMNSDMGEQTQKPSGRPPGRTTIGPLGRISNRDDEQAQEELQKRQPRQGDEEGQLGISSLLQRVFATNTNLLPVLRSLRGAVAILLAGGDTTPTSSSGGEKDKVPSIFSNSSMLSEVEHEVLTVKGLLAPSTGGRRAPARRRNKDLEPQKFSARIDETVRQLLPERFGDVAGTSRRTLSTCDVRDARRNFVDQHGVEPQSDLIPTELLDDYTWVAEMQAWQHAKLIEMLRHFFLQHSRTDLHTFASLQLLTCSLLQVPESSSSRSTQGDVGNGDDKNSFSTDEKQRVVQQENIGAQLDSIFRSAVLNREILSTRSWTERWKSKQRFDECRAVARREGAGACNYVGPATSAAEINSHAASCSSRHLYADIKNGTDYVDSAHHIDHEDETSSVVDLPTAAVRPPPHGPRTTSSAAGLPQFRAFLLQQLALILTDVVAEEDLPVEEEGRRGEPVFSKTHADRNRFTTSELSSLFLFQTDFLRETFLRREFDPQIALEDARNRSSSAAAGAVDQDTVKQNNEYFSSNVPYLCQPERLLYVQEEKKHQFGPAPVEELQGEADEIIFHRRNKMNTDLVFKSALAYLRRFRDLFIQGAKNMALSDPLSGYHVTDVFSTISDSGQSKTMKTGEIQLVQKSSAGGGGGEGDEEKMILNRDETTVVSSLDRKMRGFRRNYDNNHVLAPDEEVELKMKMTSKNRAQQDGVPSVEKSSNMQNPPEAAPVVLVSAQHQETSPGTPRRSSTTSPLLRLLWEQNEARYKAENGTETCFLRENYLWPGAPTVVVVEGGDERLAGENYKVDDFLSAGRGTGTTATGSRWLKNDKAKALLSTSSHHPLRPPWFWQDLRFTEMCHDAKIFNEEAEQRRVNHAAPAGASSNKFLLKSTVATPQRPALNALATQDENHATHQDELQGVSRRLSTELMKELPVVLEERNDGDAAQKSTLTSHRILLPDKLNATSTRAGALDSSTQSAGGHDGGLHNVNAGTEEVRSAEDDLPYGKIDTPRLQNPKVIQVPTSKQSESIAIRPRSIPPPPAATTIPRSYSQGSNEFTSRNIKRHELLERQKRATHQLEQLAKEKDPDRDRVKERALVEEMKKTQELIFRNDMRRDNINVRDVDQQIYVNTQKALQRLQDYQNKRILRLDRHLKGHVDVAGGPGLSTNATTVDHEPPLDGRKVGEMNMNKDTSTASSAPPSVDVIIPDEKNSAVEGVDNPKGHQYEDEPHVDVDAVHNLINGKPSTEQNYVTTTYENLGFGWCANETGPIETRHLAIAGDVERPSGRGVPFLDSSKILKEECEKSCTANEWKIPGLRLQLDGGRRPLPRSFDCRGYMYSNNCLIFVNNTPTRVSESHEVASRQPRPGWIRFPCMKKVVSSSTSPAYSSSIIPTTGTVAARGPSSSASHTTTATGRPSSSASHSTTATGRGPSSDTTTTTSTLTSSPTRITSQTNIKPWDERTMQMNPRPKNATISDDDDPGVQGGQKDPQQQENALDSQDGQIFTVAMLMLSIALAVIFGLVAVFLLICIFSLGGSCGSCCATTCTYFSCELPCVCVWRDEEKATALKDISGDRAGPREDNSNPPAASRGGPRGRAKVKTARVEMERGTTTTPTGGAKKNEVVAPASRTTAKREQVGEATGAAAAARYANFRKSLKLHGRGAATASTTTEAAKRSAGDVAAPTTQAAQGRAPEVVPLKTDGGGTNSSKKGNKKVQSHAQSTSPSSVVPAQQQPPPSSRPNLTQPMMINVEYDHKLRNFQDMGQRKFLVGNQFQAVKSRALQQGNVDNVSKLQPPAVNGASTGVEEVPRNKDVDMVAYEAYLQQYNQNQLQLQQQQAQAVAPLRVKDHSYTPPAFVLDQRLGLVGGTTSTAEEAVDRRTHKEQEDSSTAAASLGKNFDNLFRLPQEDQDQLAHRPLDENNFKLRLEDHVENDNERQLLPAFTFSPGDQHHSALTFSPRNTTVKDERGDETNQRTSTDSSMISPRNSSRPVTTSSGATNRSAPTAIQEKTPIHIQFVMQKIHEIPRLSCKKCMGIGFFLWIAAISNATELQRRQDDYLRQLFGIQ